MKLKDLLNILKTFDPESIVVSLNSGNNTVIPIEEVYQGSLMVTPKWSNSGKMIRDDGGMAKDQVTKDFFDMKNTDIHLAICIK